MAQSNRFIPKVPRFPDSMLAMKYPNGLLAEGGALTVDWLLAAYRRGIFPWFNDDDPIMWWTPDPRLVLFPQDVRLNRTLKRQLRQSAMTHITFDRAFAEVIEHCADTRSEGTWITDDLKAAYCEANRQGLAHSIEVWQDDNLIGGMYGIAIGDIFFGESMFSLQQSASRFAILALLTTQSHLKLLDCQVASDHLLAFGATLISREKFETLLKTHTPTDTTEILPTHGAWRWDQEISKSALIQQVLAS